jgi:hypothetical protein
MTGHHTAINTRTSAIAVEIYGASGGKENDSSIPDSTILTILDILVPVGMCW